MAADTTGSGVVVDTNVWISGLLLKTGAPALLTRWVIGHSRPVFSQETYAELSERLRLPKFDRYVTMGQRVQLLHDIQNVAHWINIPQGIAKQLFCRDSHDDKFSHVALAAQANWLVTGDKDLLVLAEELRALGVRIISPADALQLPEIVPSTM